MHMHAFFFSCWGRAFFFNCWNSFSSETIQAGQQSDLTKLKFHGTWLYQWAMRNYKAIYQIISEKHNSIISALPVNSGHGHFARDWKWFLRVKITSIRRQVFLEPRFNVPMIRLSIPFQLWSPDHLYSSNRVEN
jgi:REP element-mobilizing transposase RayT